VTVSRYPARFDDPLAEYLIASDGHANASPALQAAIDRVEQRHGSGIVFVPSGTYRLDDTVHLWRGIRLIGFGPRRPVFVLADHTPGCDGERSRYMVHFCDARPKPGEPIKDAANTTFYSAISNIDFRIGQGNPSAVAVRYHVAQLCSLEFIDFHIGSGRAAVEAIGNQIHECRFFGGAYGILGGPTSAGWQSLVMDCIFEGQREACMVGQRSGLTIIRCQFRRSPHAIVVPVMRTEQLYMRDSRMEQIGGDAIQLSEESNPYNQANVENLVCRDVKTLLRFRPSNSAVGSDAPMYRVKRLSHGLHIEPNNGRHMRHMDTRVDDEPLAAMPELPETDIAAPPPQESWTNVRTLGAVGDGVADDTEAFRRAIAAHRAIYVPLGRWRITDTLELGPDTAIFGLHPQQTQMVVPPAAAGFGDPARPRPVLLAPAGGINHVAGLCVDAGVNPGAVAIKWMAGPRSLLEDVWFEWGGHGADPKGTSHLHSLWITGGGGTFRNIWSPNIGATNGLCVSDTNGPGVMYLISVEHHRDVEVVLRNVRNWRFVALQTEENYGSHNATALTLDDCHSLEFDNLFLYRVMSMKAGHPHAVRLSNSQDIALRGLHCFSWGKHPFDNAVHDASRDIYIPEREAALVVM